MNIRSLNLKWLACLLLTILSAQLASAQYVYKIKADTVRIYNTCDSAELVLQNRTQNVQGFLYNKGQGVTEFRSLSDSFILNQNSRSQVANFSINGSGAVTGSLTSGKWMVAKAGFFSDHNTTSGGTLHYVLRDSLSHIRWGIGTQTLETGAGNAGSDFSIFRYNDAGGNVSASDFFIQRATGNIGLHNSNPTHTLEVSGTGNFTGDVSVNGAYSVSQAGRFKGWNRGTLGSGPAVEVGMNGNIGHVEAFNPDNRNYYQLVLAGGLDTVFKNVIIDSTGVRFPYLKSRKILGTDAGGYLIDMSNDFAAAANGAGYIWNQHAVEQSADFFINGTANIGKQLIIGHGADASASVIIAQTGFVLFTDPRYKFGNRDHKFLRTNDVGQLVQDSVRWADLFSKPTTLTGYGITDAAPISGAAGYIWNTTSPQPSSNFNIGGNGNVGGNLTVGPSTNGGNIGIGTASPSNYGYGIGTNNRFLEVLNPNTTANSMSEVVLSTGATVPGCIGSLIWAAKNTAYNPIKGAAYIAAYLDTSAAQKVRADMTFATADDSLPLERLRITNKGLIGIYNPFPKYRLDVNGAGHFTGGVYSNSGFLTTMTTTSSGTVHYQIRTGGEKLRWAIGTQVVETDTTTNNGSDFTIFRYNTDGTFLTNTDFVINRNTGYTGIGTRTPTNKLDIATSGGAGLRVRANTTGTAVFSSHVVDLQSSNYTGGLAFTVPANGTGELQAYTSTTESGNILLNPNGGSIIVGSTATSSAYKLDVNGQGHFQNAVIGSGVSGFYQDGNNGAYRAFGAMSSTTNRGFFLQDSAGSVSTMYVGLTGTYARKVGINTTAPAVALDVAGDIHASGAITAPSISQTSLRSLKKDIKPFTASALNILDSAQVRTFIFKADTTNTTRIGFIADEVPDAMASTGRKGVEETNTVALLVKAIQEMKAEVEALQQHVHELEAQLKEKNK